MVSMIKRMRHLKTKLLAIRLGPGAALLPREIERIHLDFAPLINDGHRGPRKFWRHMLPRLKYHNPAIPMTVSRTQEQSGPAILSVYFRKANADASSAGSSQTDQVETATQPTDTSASATTTASSTATTTATEPLLPSATLPSNPSPLRKLPGHIKTTIPAPTSQQTVVTIDMKHKSEDEILSAFLRAAKAKEVEPTQGELDDLRELEEFREKSLRDSVRSKGVRAAWKREEEMLKAAKGDVAIA